MLSDSDLTASEQLENALQTLKTDPLIKTHKICIIIVTDFQTLLAYDVKTDDTFDVEFAEPNRDYTFFLQLGGGLNVPKTLANTMPMSKRPKKWGGCLILSSAITSLIRKMTSMQSILF